MTRLRHSFGVVALLATLALSATATASPGHGPVAAPAPVLIESGCSYSTSVTTDGSYVWGNGSFSCGSSAGSGRYRAVQVCLYKAGVQKGCQYNTYTGKSGAVHYGCPHYSGGSATWQSWVWFRDQYGATTSKWGTAVNSYNSSVC